MDINNQKDIWLCKCGAYHNGSRYKCPNIYSSKEANTKKKL